MASAASLHATDRVLFSRELTFAIIIGSFLVSVASASANLLNVVSETGDVENSPGLSPSVAVFDDPLFAEMAMPKEVASEDPFAQIRQRRLRNVNLDDKQSLIVRGAPGETVVLNLKNFVMSDTSTFTLQGTATTNFVIKVTNEFSLSGRAKIVLSGGIHWNNVRFNVRWNGCAVRLSGRSELVGILTAKHRKVKLTGNSIVRGQVFARRVVLRGNSQIIEPPVVSP